MSNSKRMGKFTAAFLARQDPGNCGLHLFQVAFNFFSFFKHDICTHILLLVLCSLHMCKTGNKFPASCVPANAAPSVRFIRTELMKTSLLPGGAGRVGDTAHTPPTQSRGFWELTSGATMSSVTFKAFS